MIDNVISAVVIRRTPDESLLDFVAKLGVRQKLSLVSGDRKLSPKFRSVFLL